MADFWVDVFDSNTQYYFRLSYEQNRFASDLYVLFYKEINGIICTKKTCLCFCLVLRFGKFAAVVINPYLPIC